MYRTYLPTRFGRASSSHTNSSFSACSRGASFVEYLILLGLVALAAAIAFRAFVTTLGADKPILTSDLPDRCNAGVCPSGSSEGERIGRNLGRKCRHDAGQV